MAIFNNDPTVVQIGVDYLKIVVISYLFTAITFTFASGLRRSKILNFLCGQV